MNYSNSKIKLISKKTLEIEANTLLDAREIIDDQYCEIVQLIHKCEGRLVITGIGKSAIAAQKMVSTFNSTGTPSLFLHAADALHGDMGMIKKDDLLICISKSGNSPEIATLLPFIKGMGTPIIGIHNRQGSTLAQLSDYSLYIPLKEEADPNNLAPTASTLSHIAIGDAIAVSLIEIRGFTPQHFAQYHPGGQLGKELYMTTGHLCAHNEKPKVNLSSSVREVILEISSKRLGATCVLDEHGEIAGIITDGDIRRMLSHHESTGHLTAEDIMSKHPKSITLQNLAIDALNLMKNNNITCLLVTDKDQYHGMIHLHDILKEGFS